MKSQVLVNNADANKRSLLKNRLSALFKEISHAASRPEKMEEEGHDLLQIREPHGLIKAWQQGRRGAAVPRKT